MFLCYFGRFIDDKNLTKHNILLSEGVKMRDKVNRQFLGFLNRSKADSKRIAKNIANRQKKHSRVINVLQSLKAMYGKIEGLRCQICNEDRCIEFCHIYPVNEGGDSSVYNLLVLCPNHHYLFDNKRLTDKEYESIKPRVELAFKYNELVKKA